MLGKVKTFLLILCFHACKEKMTLLEVDLDELFAFNIDEIWNIIHLLAYLSTDVLHSIANSNPIYLCFNL